MEMLKFTESLETHKEDYYARLLEIQLEQAKKETDAAIREFFKNR